MSWKLTKTSRSKQDLLFYIWNCLNWRIKNERDGGPEAIFSLGQAKTGSFFWQFREPSIQHIPPTRKKQLKQNNPTQQFFLILATPCVQDLGSKKIQSRFL